MVHALKTLPEFFSEVGKGKTFEVRKNDRGFKVGDTLWLMEWSDAKGYTGIDKKFKVSYILEGERWGIMPGYCVMGLAAVSNPTTRVSGAAVSRPLDPLVMRFINKEELMTGNEDLTVQFGEDPPWDDLPPVDREKANKELESRLIFDSWTCRFCGGTFADRTLAIKHAIDCDDNEDVHSCATCASYEIGEDTRDGYRHICKGNPKRIDTWMKHCPEWIEA